LWIPSLYALQRAISSKQALCHVMAQNFISIFSTLEKNAARLVRQTGPGPMAESGLPDGFNARLEAGLPRLLERQQKHKAANQLCGSLDAAGGGGARAPLGRLPLFCKLA
jgi:hypothetical protein